MVKKANYGPHRGSRAVVEVQLEQGVKTIHFVNAEALKVYIDPETLREARIHIETLAWQV
jgi:hypothetical protein